MRWFILYSSVDKRQFVSTQAAIYTVPKNFGTSNPGIIAEHTKRTKYHINLWLYTLILIRVIILKVTTQFKGS